MLSRFSHVQLFVILWTVAHQLLCPWDSPGKNNGMGWLTFPSPGDLPNPGIKLRSPALQVDSLPTEPPGKPLLVLQFNSDQFSRSVVSDSLWPHESQHARPPCPWHIINAQRMLVSIWHIFFKFNFFDCTVWLVGSYFHDQALNLCPLHKIDPKFKILTSHLDRKRGKVTMQRDVCQ